MEFPAILFAVFFIAIIVLAVWAWGASSECPACGKWWALKEQSRRELHRVPGMKWVTRTETQTDSRGRTSYIQRQIQIHIMRVTYDGFFSCKECGHSFNKEIVEELEDW